MTLSFVGSRSLFPSPWARIISNKMPRHKLLSKALSSKRETTSSEPNPGSECSSGVSVPELHVFVRKKRVKKAVEVSENKLKAEPLDQDGASKVAEGWGLRWLKDVGYDGGGEERKWCWLGLTSVAEYGGFWVTMMAMERRGEVRQREVGVEVS
ncbi:hypothetical protein CsSME_00019901 [Camellia sinensis var. sinensis]